MTQTSASKAAVGQCWYATNRLTV